MASVGLGAPFVVEPSAGPNIAAAAGEEGVRCISPRSPQHDKLEGCGLDVAVTGARGFIRRHLCKTLTGSADHRALPLDREDATETVREYLAQAEYMVHLAGVNRPDDPAEFGAVNVGLEPNAIAKSSRQLEGRLPIIFASSIQAELDNPYGRSKLDAESVLQAHARVTGSAVQIARLPNVFGPGGRPFYNSVVATFAYLISHDRPITIDDPDRELSLVYVGDVVEQIVDALADDLSPGVNWLQVGPICHVTVEQLADHLTNPRRGHFVRRRENVVVETPGHT